MDKSDSRPVSPGHPTWAKNHRPKKPQHVSWKTHLDIGMIAGQISQIPFDKRRFQWKSDFFFSQQHIYNVEINAKICEGCIWTCEEAIYTWYILPLGWFYATKPTYNQKSSLARSRSKFGFSFPWFTGKKNAVDVSNLSESYNLLMARVWKVSWVRGVGNCLQGKCGVRNVTHMYIVVLPSLCRRSKDELKHHHLLQY